MNELQNKVAGALIGLVRSLDETNTTEEVYHAIIEGLRALRTDQEEKLLGAIDFLHAQKRKAVPDCSVCMNPCGKTSDYTMSDLENLKPEERRARLILLDKLTDFALCRRSPEFTREFPVVSQAIFAIGYDYYETEEIHGLCDRVDQLIRENEET